ncbi:hypothetical protein SDC9_166341 [bioreactor metagenome]|uniref:Uncharacterized protein n=1 Tax=bioreactor metagenome TaxID=1076179 RepID=A0A645FX08_9ZZZZ
MYAHSGGRDDAFYFSDTVVLFGFDDSDVQNIARYCFADKADDTVNAADAKTGTVDGFNCDVKKSIFCNHTFTSLF